MTRILLDSGILSDYLNRRRDIFDRVRSLTEQGVCIGTCVPVIAEIAAGVELSSSRERNMPPFLAALETLEVWPFDQIAAYKYGQIFAEQRKKGRQVQIVDMMIAAVAITLGECKVVTTDSDLLSITGLKAEIW